MTPPDLQLAKLPFASRVVRLRSRPPGLPRASDFEIVSESVGAPGPGEVLVRNRFFRIPATVRMMIGEGARPVDGVPIPALAIGDALREETLGEVLQDPAGRLPAGALVRHGLGFREYALVPVDDCEPVEEDLPDPAAHLGHGWTAYAALTRAARVRAGETVFVSSAAGAIGSMAAFIARRLGASRVIGSTSSAEKGARLVAELGYDRAVVRGAMLLDQLGEAAPEGLDVVLDQTGGEALAAGVTLARRGARVIVLGALSGQLAAEGTGRTAPVMLDSFPMILRRLTIRGYSADDDPDARGEWNRLYGDAWRRGEMSFPHARIHGLDGVPEALADVARGRYVGAVLAALDDPARG